MENNGIDCNGSDVFLLWNDFVKLFIMYLCVNEVVSYKSLNIFFIKRVVEILFSSNIFLSDFVVCINYLMYYRFLIRLWIFDWGYFIKS